jgi:hypothetical protein
MSSTGTVVSVAVMSLWSDAVTPPGIVVGVAIGVGVSVAAAVTVGVWLGAIVAVDISVGSGVTVRVGLEDGVFSGSKPHAGSLRQPEVTSSEKLTTPS